MFESCNVMLYEGKFFNSTNWTIYNFTSTRLLMTTIFEHMAKETNQRRLLMNTQWPSDDQACIL